LDSDLTRHLGPIEPVLARVDPILAKPIHLTSSEFQDLVAFVRNGLMDDRAKKGNLCKLVPNTVPSGFSVLRIETCPPN
jgi:cytochrome c peroxidase